MPSEPPGADPHAGWCGGRRGELGAYPILCGGRAEPYSKARPYRDSVRNGTSWSGRCEVS